MQRSYTPPDPDICSALAFMGNQPNAITRFYGNGQLFQPNDFRVNIGIPRSIIPISRAMIALADF